MRTLLLAPATLLLLLAACSRPAPPTTPPEVSEPAAEEAVRRVVADLQKVLKSHDADAVWDLLSDRPRAEAERIAEVARKAYLRADAGGKTKLEEQFGLDAAAFAALDGKGYLRTKVFARGTDELANAQSIAAVTVRNNEATVEYVEPDDDHATLILVKADGRWKVNLPIPQEIQP
jgi:hypothetical protein